MKTSRATALVAISLLALGACRFPGLPGPKAPTGQVVATVGGKEITLLELQAELAGTQGLDAKSHKAAEQQALRMIVARTVLAEEARKESLDKTPDFVLQEQRTTDGILAQTLQKKMADGVPAPTNEEAQQFISDHPDIFAQRKIFVVDTIRLARSTDPKVIQGIEPLKTLPDVDAYLTAQHVEHARAAGNIDVVGLEPKMVDQLVKLPPNEVFLYPANGMILVNQIRETHVVPFQGDQATKYALAVMKRDRTQEAVGRQIQQMLASAQVHYNDAYKPAPRPPATAPKPAS